MSLEPDAVDAAEREHWDLFQRWGHARMNPRDDEIAQLALNAAADALIAFERDHPNDERFCLFWPDRTERAYILPPSAPLFAEEEEVVWYDTGPELWLEFTDD